MYTTSHSTLAITETWLSDYDFDNEILPTNFSIYRKDRDSRGGGVLLATHAVHKGNMVLPLMVLEEEFTELDRYVVLPLTVLEELAELDRRLEQV